MSFLSKLLGRSDSPKPSEHVDTRAEPLTPKGVGSPQPKATDQTFGELAERAYIYFEKGEYAQAEPLYRRALLIAETVDIVQDSPQAETATVLNALAGCCMQLGRRDEAESLYKRALAIQQQIQGDSHPDVAMTLHNTGLLVAGAGRYHEAEPLFRKALEIREATLGPADPRTASTRKYYMMLPDEVRKR